MRFILLLIFILVSLTACTSIDEAKLIEPASWEEWSETDSELNEIPTEGSIDTSTNQEPTYVGNLNAYQENDMLIVYFSLYDEHYDYTSADGTASITIRSDDGNQLVYESSRDISSSGFDSYTKTMTGERFTAYEMQIPISQIQKTLDESGTVYLDLKTDDGSEFGQIDSRTFDLPVFTDEEVDQLRYEKYLESSIEVEKTTKYIGLEVTLNRVGYYDIERWGETERYFRADFTIYNKNRDESGLSTYDAYLLHGRNQYDRSFRSDLDVYDIRKGVERSGYILFEDIPDDLSGKVTISAGTAYDWDDYDEVEFTFTVDLP